MPLAHASAVVQEAMAAVRQHFLWSAGFSALVNLLFLAPTIYMLQIYDRVVPTRGSLTLVFLTLVLVFALATLALLDYVRSRLLVRASVRLDRLLAGAILDATMGIRRGTGEVMVKQAIREFDTLRQALTGPAILALFDAPWTPIYIVVCALIHPWIGLLAVAGTLLVLAIAKLNHEATSERLRRASEAANRSYVSQEQSTVGAEVIRALGMRRAMVQRHLDERAMMMLLQGEASFATSKFATASKFVRLALQSLALGLGALLAIDNLISAGAIFAASFLLGRALAPVDQLVGASRQLSQARAAYSTVNSLLEMSETEVGTTHLPAPTGQLSVEHLTVMSPSKEVPILTDVSLRLSPGEVIAIIGPSGAGKSTLARAVSGALTPDRGAIRIDGAERSDWDQERLARYLGYLPQEPSLFAGTIKENISRFSVGLPQTEIDLAAVEAARQCGAHDMILRFPNGYDTVLGWGGSGLSAGQAQRIAMARSLYGEPSLVILDEPNAHLDAEGEARLLETLQQLKDRGAAVLLIAHRMGVMHAVDQILLLVGGRVEALGERDEVLKRLGRTPTPIPMKAQG